VIASVIARLADQVKDAKLIAGASAFAAAANANPTAVPALYVIPLRETASDNAGSIWVEQRIDVAIGVIVVVKSVADTKGGAAQSDLDALRRAVCAALLGWLPAGAVEPLIRGESGYLTTNDGHFWWQDTWRTAYYERSQA
jgi:hypothetical protein